MIRTATQLKAKVKNLSGSDSTKAQTLIRNYIIERFLEKSALERVDNVTEKWSEHYPHAMNRWHENWDAISPIFKFSKDVRTAFYTTNAIESLNSSFRRLNRQRSVFRVPRLC